VSDPSTSGLAAGNTTNNLAQVLADAMTYILSQEENNSIAAITMDSLLNDYLNSIMSSGTTSVVDPEGNTLYNRPSTYDQLTALQNSINTAVTAIQNAGTDPAKLAALGLSPSPPASATSGSSS
jgi:hypothetical protein